MGTNERRADTTGPTADRDGPPRGRRARRVLLGVAASAVTLGSVGAVSAQGASGGATGGGGSGLYVTAAALALTGLAIGAVYLFSWRDRPKRTFTPATPTEDSVVNRHTGEM